MDTSGELSSRSGEENPTGDTTTAPGNRPDSDPKVGVQEDSSSGTLPSQNSLVCRICQSTEVEALLSPCQCLGTLAYVHRSCLEKWLTVSGRDYCELCGHRYPVVRERTYGMCAGLRVWVSHGNVCCHLLLDLCMMLACGVAIGLIAWTCVRASRSASISSKPLLYTFSGLGALAYCLIIHTLLKIHLVHWWRWWHRSVRIRLQLDE